MPELAKVMLGKKTRKLREEEINHLAKVLWINSIMNEAAGELLADRDEVCIENEFSSEEDAETWEQDWQIQNEATKQAWRATARFIAFQIFAYIAGGMKFSKDVPQEGS
jgi:hypothetical protein